MAALKLDRIDLNILSQLQRNGRITNIDHFGDRHDDFALRQGMSH